MWTYEINTGRLLNPQGHLAAIGYSGHADGRNNPNLVKEPNVGPLPPGYWLIADPNDLPRLGKAAMRLQPFTTTQTYGRSGFYMHGDDTDGLEDASLGCLVIPRPARDAISKSTDRVLYVLIAQPDPTALLP